MKAHSDDIVQKSIARGQKHNDGLVRFGQDLRSGDDLWIGPNTLSTHMQVIGGTRTGKSYFLEQIARELISLPKKQSVVVIDPHGSLYYRLMDYCVRRQDADRVIFFNPTSNPIIGYNPVRRIGNATPYYQAVMALEACRKVWGEESFDKTPRMNRWLYNAFMAVLEADLTMHEQVYMLNPLQRFDAQRRSILKGIRNEFVRSDWEWFLQQQDRVREERTESSSNRLKLFVENEDVLNVLARQEQILDLDQIIADGKILLVNLAPHEGGRLTTQHTSLLGTLLVNDILAACFRRSPKERQKRPAYLMLDEFQHFVTKDLCVILNEGRKFGLHLILAHHHMGPLLERDPEVYHSVLTNAATKVVFGGLSIEDARTFVEQLYRFDLDERKFELYSPYDRPVSEWVDIVTEQEGSAWHSGVASVIQSGEAYRPEGYFGDELVGTSKGKTRSDVSGGATSKGKAVTHAPITTYIHDEVLSSVQFRSLEEQIRRAEEKLIDQPTQFAAIKTRGRDITFFKVPNVRPFRLSSNERDEYKQQIIESAGCYAKLEEIEAERLLRQRTLGITTSETVHVTDPVDILTPDDEIEEDSPWH